MTVTDFDADETIQPLKRAGAGRYSTSDKMLVGVGVMLAAGAAFFPWYVFLNPEKFSVPTLWQGATRDLPETPAREVVRGISKMQAPAKAAYHIQMWARPAPAC